MAMLVLSATALAQNITVKGSVVDETGEGIVGASVQVKGTTTGIAADLDGNFTIAVPSNAILVISSIGYETKEVAVAGKTFINVTLKSDNEFIESAVVLGYGSAKKVSTLVGSVATVNSETVKSTPAATALDALQGQVAGMSVLTTGGVSGDNNVSMTLHGVGSLGASSTPLFVIDGIPSSSSAVMNMNPNDIESVSVLKDASATSIYGSRAANGVVYVSTKQGAYNESARISLRSTWGVSTIADMTYYNNMMTGSELLDFWQRSGLASAEYLYNTYISKGYTNNTQWWRKFYNTNTLQSQNDVSIEGGGKTVAYVVSFSQYHQDGTTVGNYYDRYTLRTNLQGHPTSWLKFGVNANMSIDETQRNTNFGNSSNAGGNNYLYGGLSVILNPLYPDVLKPDGRYEASNYQDPKVRFDNTDDVYKSYNLNGSAFVTIEPVRNLKFTSRVGTDAGFSINKYYRNPSYVASNGSGSRYRNWEGWYTNTITNTIEYSFNIANKHEISLLAGQEGVDYKYDAFTASSTGQTNDKQLRLQDGLQAQYDVSESWSQYRFLSFFGHADYSFDKKYMFDVTVRNDASSRFGKDNRNAFFWSVGAMWKIGKENFMKNATWINDLDLKVSYGTQGNAAIGNYGHLGLIGKATDYATGQSWVLSQPSNNSLSWEKQGLFTVGLRARLFNRLNFEVEYYKRNTSNMLMDVPYPYTAGFSEQTSNVGTLSNTGVDLTLGLDILRTRDAFITLNATFNYNKQVVTELFNGLDKWTVASTGITYVVGQPVSFYYPLWAGVDPEDGAPTWYLPYGYEEYQASVEAGAPNTDLIDITRTRKDPNATTKSFNEDLLMQNTGIARYNPINGGFGISGGWKGFSVRADFTYMLGKYLINNDGYFVANPNSFFGYNQSKDVTDFWTPTHTDAKYPNWGDGYTMQFDSHLLQDASFLRLKSLIVSYTLPASWLGWQKAVKGITLSFTGRNLLTFTKYEGIDPEVNSNLTLGLPGNSKQFLGGIQIQF
ncbi:MAG: SusC/RagA family TonB-linked outer membrane protein [Bacteroidales bacterium]|nr:SusC/RagA family TonB-linked outer membrane protein [Bacteroidales bacterium]